MTDSQGYRSGTRLHRSVGNYQGNAAKPRQDLPKVAVIKDVVHRGHMENFCRELLSNGVKVGNTWRVGNIHNAAGKASNNGGSCVVNLGGRDAGLIWDWATEEKFDIIDVVMARKGMTKPEAIAWTRLRIAMPVEELNAYVPREKTAEELAAEAEKKAKDIAAALKIWNETGDIIGTDAETYLRWRGIKQALPTSLRFHPKLGYWDSGAEGKPVFVGNFPALVCMVQRADGSFCGVQRIYLAEAIDPETGEVTVRKAPVRAPKKARGDILGGAVRCCDDEDIRGEVGICEGIEDALSIPSLYDEKPAWAAVSARGIAGIELPAWVTHPVFYPDNDPPQRKADGSVRLNKDGKPIYPGPDACAEAAARLKSETCHPRIALIRGGKDANAVLMAENGLVL